jgi:hypothetical protein
MVVAAALLALSVVMTPAQWSPRLPSDVQGRCPAGLAGIHGPGIASGQPPALRVRYGGQGAGRLSGSALLSNLTEVMWVGPECLEVFAGSPSVHKLPGDGGWLFAHDFFGSSYRLRGMNNTVQVLHSADAGASWQYRSNVSGIYWAGLFAHNGATYLMGTHGDDFRVVSPPNKVPMKGGPVTISKSTDLGKSFSKPSVILQGSFQTAPTPVVSVNGTLYRSMEDSSVGGVGALVMWADADADLLQASSWSRSSSTVPTTHCAGAGTCLQEGSVLEAPSGEIWNVLRVNSQTKTWNNKAAITVLDRQMKTLSFKQYVDGPFGSSKFTIRREPLAGNATTAGSGSAGAATRYFAVSTNVTEQAIALGSIGARNNLVLSTSLDLVSWHVCCPLAQDDTGFAAADSARYTGFEYPDMAFDGRDLMVGIRTAYRGAVSGGSSNRMTSMRVAGYRVRCGLPPRPAGDSQAGL